MSRIQFCYYGNPYLNMLAKQSWFRYLTKTRYDFLIKSDKKSFTTFERAVDEFKKLSQNERPYNVGSIYCVHSIFGKEVITWAIPFKSKSWLSKEEKTVIKIVRSIYKKNYWASTDHMEEKVKTFSISYDELLNVLKGLNQLYRILNSKGYHGTNKNSNTSFRLDGTYKLFRSICECMQDSKYLSLENEVLISEHYHGGISEEEKSRIGTRIKIGSKIEQYYEDNPISPWEPIYVSNSWTLYANIVPN